MGMRIAYYIRKNIVACNYRRIVKKHNNFLKNSENNRYNNEWGQLSKSMTPFSDVLYFLSQKFPIIEFAGKLLPETVQWVYLPH